MANQPTKYRKFLVGAASAALVASAVAPVASAATPELSDVKGNTHAEGINALLAAGVINGYPDGTFLPNKTLTRSDVVKMMGKWLVSLDHKVPTDYKTVQRFSDLPLTANDELLQYAALVKDKGVFQGSDGKLLASDDITRENMALVLVRAFDTIHDVNLVEFVKEQTFKKDVTDLATAKAEAQPAIDVLDYFDITNPVAPQFNPKNTTTRGQFASFLYKTTKVDPAAVDLKIDSVDSVKAITTTVDNSTTGQVLELAINKNERKVTVAQLEKAGFTVEFQASKDVFNSSIGTLSSHGELSPNKLNDAYKDAGAVVADRSFTYQVVIADKDGKEVESASQRVQIADKQSVASALGDATVNRVVAGVEDIKLNSTTLVQGEEYAFTAIAATLPGNVKVSNLTKLEGYDVAYQTSNPEVLQIGSDGSLFPIKSGSATVTITSGGATKTVTFTVVNQQRYAKSATLSTNSVKISTDVVAAEAFNVGVTILDQYGDPAKGIEPYNFFATAASVVEESKTKDPLANVSFGKLDASGTLVTETGLDGKTTLNFDTDTLSKTGSGTFTLTTDVSSNKLSSVNVNVVTKPVKAASWKLEGGKTELGLPATTDVTLKAYTSAGHYMGVQSATAGYGIDDTKVRVVSSNPSVISVSDSTVTTDGKYTLTSTGVGTARVEVYHGAQRIAYHTVKVTDDGSELALVNFHDLKITSANNAPFNLLNDILNKVIVSDGSSVAYTVSGDTIEIYTVDDAGLVTTDLVGVVKFRAAIKDASGSAVAIGLDDRGVSATGVQEIFLGKDVVAEQFDVGDRGTIFISVHKDASSTSPALYAKTITVDVK